MLISKVSPISGKSNEIDIDITREQFKRILVRYSSGEYIQNIVPHLSAEHREFLISGIPPEEQKMLFGSQEP